jgi:two-component system alkaline phosphatase synthesis response regulator PhoP
MRTVTAETDTATVIGTKTACVLADRQVWYTQLADALESLGFSVSECSDLNDLFETARAQSAALVVIAQADAAAAVRACRVTNGMSELPIMVVMPREGDLIPVLDAGADDAVVSRTEPAVFLARVRALLRRTQPENQVSNNVMRVRELAIDYEKYQVSLRGEQVQLTPTEFRLLAVLAQQAGRVVDPRALLSAVHQHDYSERDAQNLVKVHIANLRRKLNDSRSNNPYILCVRGFGYMLERRGRTRQDDPLAALVEQE